MSGYPRFGTENSLEFVGGSGGKLPGYDGGNDNGWSSQVEGQNPSHILLAVMGVTGVGKTSFINVATGGVRSSEFSLEPSMSKVQEHEPYERHGCKITLVDIPGFDSSTKPDITVLEEFVQYLREKASEKVYLSGIIYLHRITDVRMSGSAMKNMQLLRVLCGDHFLPNVTLVTTMWDNIQDRSGIDRETELKTSFWADLLNHGAIYRQHNGTRGTANHVIDTYLTQSPAGSVGKSKIEQQVVEDGRLLQETDAGQFALEKLREKVQIYERKVQEKKDMKREIDDDDGLDFEADEILKEIEKGEEELDKYKRILSGYKGNSSVVDFRDSNDRRGKNKRNSRVQNTQQMSDVFDLQARPYYSPNDPLDQEAASRAYAGSTSETFFDNQNDGQQYFNSGTPSFDQYPQSGWRRR